MPPGGFELTISSGERPQTYASDRDVTGTGTESLLCKNIKIKIHRSIILSVVLYGCETWSFTLRKERRLKVFENRVLRRMFGPKREEVTRERRRLHNVELCDLYLSPNIFRLII